MSKSNLTEAVQSSRRVDMSDGGGFGWWLQDLEDDDPVMQWWPSRPRRGPLEFVEDELEFKDPKEILPLGEVDQFLRNQLARFSHTAEVLDVSSRIQILCKQTNELSSSIYQLRLELQNDEIRVLRLINEIHQIDEESGDVVYLEDFIFLLEGQFEKISLRDWPFVIRHIAGEMNLIV